MKKSKFENDKILQREKMKMSRLCEFCGHRISFYAFEKDKKVCSYCGKYNYRNDYIKFLDLMQKAKENNK